LRAIAGAIINTYKSMHPVRYRPCVFLLVGLMAFAPRALAQQAPPPQPLPDLGAKPAKKAEPPLSAPGAAPLPSLGGSGDALLSPAMERRLGESVMRDIRAKEPTYVEDPEVSEYLSELGARLAQVMSGTRYDFQFFVIRDTSVNAFALPGGFVGVHTGLINSADTESELASVLAHELGHVTQRHISRMLGQQQQMQMPMLAALAAAVVLGMRRPDLAVGGIAASQAGMVQAQLGYSRDYEREADRVGLQALADAGYDPRAMAVFFEKLQRATRIMDDGSVPGYLRSHPVTTERIADTQNKSAGMPYRQHPDSVAFHMVRAKLRADSGDARDAVATFESSVREKRYASEVAARYGLANALLRARRAQDAAAELGRLRAAGGQGPMVETLAGRVKRAQGDLAGAATLLSEARTRFPHSRPVLYACVEAQQEAGRNKEALGMLTESVRLYPRDARLHGLQAKTYAAMGKRLLQHQAQAEYYVLQGSLPAAIEQLTLARAAGDGDFYQLSVVDARLKDLRAQHQAETAKK
jgi:beta-barrel assembly-enhancing protease